MRRVFGWSALVVGFLALLFFGLAPGIIERGMNHVTRPHPPKVSAHAAALHSRLQIADMHADTLLWTRDFLDRGQSGPGRSSAVRSTGNVALQILSSVTKTPKNQNYDSNGGDTDNITGLAIAQAQPVRTWGSLLERSLWHAEKLRT